MFNLENLEYRRLLSAAIGLDFDGNLTVMGGKEQLDVIINVQLEEYIEPVARNRPIDPVVPPTVAPTTNETVVHVRATVMDGGELVYSALLDRGALRSIRVDGSNTDDSIQVMLKSVDVAAFIYGGFGNDVLSATARNSPGVEMIGGDGDDTITQLNFAATSLAPICGGDGDDYISVSSDFGAGITAAKIAGDEGNDVIRLQAGSVPTDSTLHGLRLLPMAGYTAIGGDGDDAIYGSSLNDLLYGDDGNDLIMGACGDDTIDGGLGNDSLYGDDGDDWLDHGGGIDIVDGGNGFDHAVVGKGDDAISIELLFAQ